MKGRERKREEILADRMPLSPGKVATLAISYVLLFVYVFVILWPLAQILFAGLNGNQGPRLQPGLTFTLSARHFKDLFTQTDFVNWLVNTLVMGLATAFLTLLTVLPAGYAYTRGRLKEKKTLFPIALLIRILLPLAGLGAFYGLYALIAEGILRIHRGLLLVLIYTGMGVTANTLMLKNRLDAAPEALDEAARLDGCGRLQTYFMLIRSQVCPTMALIVFWSFLGPFLDFLLPSLLLDDPRTYTLAIGLHSLIRDAGDMRQPVFAAGALLTALPVVVVFFALNRWWAKSANHV